jgi:hypothetical protein
MLFKYSYEIEALARHLPDEEALEFRWETPRQVVIRLFRKHPDGQKLADASSALCVAETSEEPTNTEIASELNAAVAGSLDGKWAMMKDVSPPTMEFVDSILGDLQKLIRRTVSVFRWREGLAEGPHNPFQKPQGFYSMDDGEWREVSLVRSIKIRFGIATGPRTPPNEICSEVVRLVDAAIEESLGHQLFREAWHERDTNPRSSLVLGVAAAEVGLKKLIGSLLPKASWLVDELQTPSLSKMIRKYLPTLPVRVQFTGKTICPPKDLVTKLERAVEYRNKLVHAGKAPPHLMELEDMLRAVNDFLWICDLYEGYVWAGRHVSAETRMAWKEEVS